MKKIYFLAATAALLASCSSNEEYFSQEFNQGAPIEFATRTVNATRANATGADAAALLNNQFIVYGQKTANDAKTQVFTKVAVNYVTDGENAAWDYVTGTEPVRYWDKTATSYDFYAYSDANATKVVAPAADIYTDGITISSTTAENLAKVYVAPGVSVTSTGFNNTVKFIFKSAASKVRIAAYNGMNDYDVKINKFYVSDGTAGTVSALQGSFFSAAAYAVTAAGVQSKTDATQDQKNVVMGGNIVAAGNLGASKADATYEDYVWVLPTGADAQNVTVKIEYTMTSKTTSETITDTVETSLDKSYFQWQPNYAYTYILKINNSLTPITFEAEVEEFTENELTVTL